MSIATSASQAAAPVTPTNSAASKLIACWTPEVQKTLLKAIRQAAIAFAACLVVSTIPFAPTLVIVANPVGVAAFVFVAKLVQTALIPVWKLLVTCFIGIFGEAIWNPIEKFSQSSTLVKGAFKAINLIFVENLVARFVCTRALPFFAKHNIDISAPALFGRVTDTLVNGSAVLITVELVDAALCSISEMANTFLRNSYAKYQASRQAAPASAPIATGGRRSSATGPSVQAAIDAIAAGGVNKMEQLLGVDGKPVMAAGAK